jgi:hypothetical protein
MMKIKDRWVLSYDLIPPSCSLKDALGTLANFRSLNQRWRDSPRTADFCYNCDMHRVEHVNEYCLLQVTKYLAYKEVLVVESDR